MIEVLAGRLADPDSVRAADAGLGPAAGVGVFLLGLAFMILPAAVGVLVLAGVFS